MFEIEPDNIVIAQNSKLKSIFYVVDGLLIAEASFQTDCTAGFRFFCHNHFENLVKQNSDDQTHYLFDLKSGLLFGQLSALTGEPSTFKVTSGWIYLQVF